LNDGITRLLFYDSYDAIVAIMPKVIRDAYPAIRSRIVEVRRAIPLKFRE